MEVDPDDLGSVLGSLRAEREANVDGGSDGSGTGEGVGIGIAMTRRLKFTNLERLHVNGYQTLAPTGRGTKAARVEGRALCFMAIGVLNVHPVLSVLVQVGTQHNPRLVDTANTANSNTDTNDTNDTTSPDTGGADARDLTFGRVKWKFLRNKAQIDPENEHVVNLVEMIALFDSLIGMDEAREGEGDGESKRWRGGKFVQYPYLRRE